MKYLIIPLTIIFLFLFSGVLNKSLAFQIEPTSTLFTFGQEIVHNSTNYTIDGLFMFSMFEEPTIYRACYYDKSNSTIGNDLELQFIDYSTNHNFAIEEYSHFNCLTNASGTIQYGYTYYDSVSETWSDTAPSVIYYAIEQGNLNDVLYSNSPVKLVTPWEPRFNTYYPDISTGTQGEVLALFNYLPWFEFNEVWNTEVPLTSKRLVYNRPDLNNSSQDNFMILSENDCTIETISSDFNEINCSNNFDFYEENFDNWTPLNCDKNYKQTLDCWSIAGNNTANSNLLKLYNPNSNPCEYIDDLNYTLLYSDTSPACSSISNPLVDELFPTFSQIQFEQLDLEAIETEFKTGSFDFLWVVIEPVLVWLNLAIDFFNSMLDAITTSMRFITNLIVPNFLDIRFQIDTFRNYMMNDLLLVQNAFVFTNMVSEIFDITTSDVPDPITFNFRGDTMTILDLSTFNWNLLVTIRILTGISYFIAIAFVIRSMVIQILGRYTTLNIRDIPIKID